VRFAGLFVRRRRAQHRGEQHQFFVLHVRRQPDRGARLRAAKREPRHVGRVAQLLLGHELEVLQRERPVAGGFVGRGREFGEPRVPAAEAEPRDRGEHRVRVHVGRDAVQVVLQFQRGRALQLVAVAQRVEVAREARAGVGGAERHPTLPHGRERAEAEQQHWHLPQVARGVERDRRGRVRGHERVSVRNGTAAPVDRGPRFARGWP
jgi:hypothetical protein